MSCGGRNAWNKCYKTVYGEEVNTELEDMPYKAGFVNQYMWPVRGEVWQVSGKTDDSFRTPFIQIYNTITDSWRVSSVSLEDINTGHWDCSTPIDRDYNRVWKRFTK